MPIFEFHCKACDLIFEKLVLSQSQSIACKQCGGPVEKLMSAATVKTKGADGQVKSTTSSCSSCTASSCAGCH